MLLGRVANGLYWMNRYIERAENMARLVDAGLRMALTRTQSAGEEWKSVVLSAGADVGFSAKYSEYTAGAVSDFLIRDTSNPSSSMSSMETARFNARMVRTALTRETWESINEAWMALKRMLAKPIDERDLPAVLDEIKAGIPSHVTANLAEAPAATARELRERMSGNICRCGAYSNIIDAITDVAGVEA